MATTHPTELEELRWISPKVLHRAAAGEDIPIDTETGTLLMSKAVHRSIQAAWKRLSTIS